VFGYFMNTPESAGLLAGHDKLHAWWSAVSQRPSFTGTQPQFG